MGQASTPVTSARPARQRAGSASGDSHPSTFYTVRSTRPGQNLVAVDLTCWKKLQQAIDERGPDARLSTDEVFVIDGDTAIEVLRKTQLWAEIRVLSGPWQGRSGLVAPESV